MAVALRVLTSIKDRESPAQADIASLQSWVDAKDRSADYDELACMVINAELKRRKNERVTHEDDRRSAFG